MPSRKRKGRGRKLTLRKGAATASKLKGKLKTAAKKQIEEENSQNSVHTLDSSNEVSITPSIEGTDSHIDLDNLVRQTEKSFSDVEMDDAEAARVNQGEELEILPGTSGIYTHDDISDNQDSEIPKSSSTRNQGLQLPKKTRTPNTQRKTNPFNNSQQNSTTIDEERLHAFEEAVEDEVERDRDPDYVPVRKSDRLKGKDRLEYSLKQRNHIRDPERIKSENEKKEFYDAIRKYGTKDLESLMAALPDRTEDSIKSLIYKEKRKQAYTEERRAVREDGTYEVVGNIIRKIQEPKKSDSEPASRSDTPEHLWRENFTGIEQNVVKIKTHSAIDEWIGNIKSIREKNDAAREKAGRPKAPHCENMISNSLNWIAEFEDHPDPDECGGIDYASIYRYFACLSEGEVPPSLNPVTSARVTRLLSDISYLAIGNLNSNESDYLENYRGPLSRYTTTEDFDEKSTSVAQFEKMSSLPGLNSLNIHPELCTDKKLDLSKITMVVEPGVLERSKALDPKKFDVL